MMDGDGVIVKVLMGGDDGAVLCSVVLGDEVVARVMDGAVMARW